MQIVKIDKTFIDNIAVSKGADDFVEAIISMGHTLKMDIIAEGVEDENQRVRLEDLVDLGLDGGGGLAGAATSQPCLEFGQLPTGFGHGCSNPRF